MAWNLTLRTRIGIDLDSLFLPDYFDVGFYFKQSSYESISVFRSEPPWLDTLEVLAVEVSSQLIPPARRKPHPFCTDIDVFNLK